MSNLGITDYEITEKNKEVSLWLVILWKKTHKKYWTLELLRLDQSQYRLYI
jgi:hypothetical protein